MYYNCHCLEFSIYHDGEIKQLTSTNVLTFFFSVQYMLVTFDIFTTSASFFYTKYIIIKCKYIAEVF